MSNVCREIIRELCASRGTSEKVKILSSFFKTGKGQYGEKDRFLGITVPDQRKIAKKYFREATFSDIEKLLDSPFHEYRLTGLFLLVYRFEKALQKERKEIYEFYIRNVSAVNNWDLVDTTTPNIIGEYMLENTREVSRLTQWAKSENIWERRIAILATYAFIKRGEFSQTIRIAKILLRDKHDLIHKAVGWMLREVGKRDEKILRHFLDVYTDKMPRTMLRYSLERFPKTIRKQYLVVRPLSSVNKRI